MKPLPRPLLSRARDQRGLLTIEQLSRSSVSSRARSELLTSGMIVPVHRGVYRLASHDSSFEQRCLAACLAAPDAAISGPSAGRLWDLRKMRTDDIHLLAGRRIKLDGVTAHRSDLLAATDVEHRGGLRLLRPHRLACDLAWFLGDEDFESVIEQMLDRRLITVASLRSTVRRFVAPGRPGSDRLARVVDARPAWRKPVDSDLELRVWRALAERGVEMVRQHRVRLDDGAVVFLDLADVESRFAVEVDHVTWHGGRLDAQADKRRDRGMSRLGWLVSRVTDLDLSEHFAATMTELADIAIRRRTNF